MKAPRLQRLLIGVLWLGVAALAVADSARGLVQRGNKAYGAGRYDEAMKAYEQADVESPESPVVGFNQGAVHYRAEDYAAARESFEKAAKASRDPAFEAKCRYNVGDTWFKEARRQMDSDLAKAVEACEHSVDNYQAALTLQPEFEAARRNIEIVRRLWKSILDEQKRRQEQQKAQQQAQQKFAEQMKQLIERQEKAAGQSTELAQKQDAEGATQAVQDQAQKQAKDQRQLGTDTQAAADQLNQMLSQAQPPAGSAQPPPATPPPTHPAQEQMNQARQLQDQAAAALDQTQPKPASSAQKEAAEALRKALESLSQKQDGQKQQQDAQNQDGQKQDQDGQKQDEGQKQDQDGQKQDEGQKQDQDGKQQGKDQQQGEKQQAQQAQEGGKEPQGQDQQQARARLADQDARDILDDEKRNRDRRTAAEQRGVAPVDKDW